MELGKMVCLILGACDELAKIQKRAGVVRELASRDHCEQTSLWVSPLGRDEKFWTILNMLRIDPWTMSDHVECNVKMQHVMSMELLPALSGCFPWSLVTGKSRSLNMVVCADVHSMVHSQLICINKGGIMFHMRLILFLFHHLAAHLNMPLQHFCTTAWTLSCDILSCCVLIQYENQSTWTNCPTGFSQFRCVHSFFIEWGFGRLGWLRFGFG